MGLAPKLNRDQQVTESNNTGSAPRGLFADASTLDVVQLRNVIRAIHWSGYKRILEDVELTIANDRQWVLFRKRIMDMASDKEREMLTAVSRLIPQPEGKNNG